MQKAASLTGRWRRLRQGLPRVKPWVVLATLLGMGVFLYWAYLGVRYGATVGEAARLDNEVARLAGSLAQATSKASPGQAELAGERFEGLAVRFKRYDSEALAGLVYEVAEASGVEVTTLVMGKASAKIEDGVHYQLQPLTLNLNGSNAKVGRFLDDFHQRIPSIVVADARLSGSGAGPTAQMQLVLYVSPQAAPKESATKK
ncbi:MAG: hypothetical protein V1724_09515 [Chloroflexota bacterium]